MKLKKNNTDIILQKSVGISFSKMANSSYYGVSRIFGNIDVAFYEDSVAKPTSNGSRLQLINSKLSFDYKPPEGIMFDSPQENSYQCKEIFVGQLEAALTWNYTQNIQQSVKNATIHATDVQFDAFRNIYMPIYMLNTDNKTIKIGVFRDPFACGTASLNAMSVVVGAVCAAVVLCVLVAYMVKQKRPRDGYQYV